MDRKGAISILRVAMLVASLVFMSCGAFDDNSQPSIESITDKTLNAGDDRSVNVYVTDADADDTHTIRAFSDDTSVATVSVDEDSLTITGHAAGMTTIEVTATDNSGQDNDTSIPVTFQVTVNAPPLPPIDKGICVVGMTLQSGESCTYFADQGPITFYVNQDNQGCRTGEQPYTTEIFGVPVEVTVDFICADEDIKGDEVNIRGNNPYDTNFHATKNPDGSWTVKNVP